jgi:hypothetical protein
MPTLLETLTQHLGGDALKQLSAQLGTDERTTNTAVSAALPAIVGALARNTSSPAGATALDSALAKDHDGSVLDNPTGALASPQLGAVGSGILKHVFGDRQGVVAAGVGEVAGLDSAKSGKLLAMLAPLVLAALARKRQTDGLDAGGLAETLGQERARLNTPGGGAFGSLMQLIDRNHDGSVVDDVGGMLGGMFKR